MSDNFARTPAGQFDSIENVPAAVALKQNNKATDPRSLIGTSADVLTLCASHLCR